MQVEIKTSYFFQTMVQSKISVPRFCTRNKTRLLRLLAPNEREALEGIKINLATRKIFSLSLFIRYDGRAINKAYFGKGP